MILKQDCYRAIQKLFHRPREGEGVKQNSDKGEGVQDKQGCHHLEKYRFNNRIRMTLKVAITPLHLLFKVFFHVYNKNSSRNYAHFSKYEI